MKAPAFGASVEWTPLLDGKRREAALRVVDEIALALAQLRPGEDLFSWVTHDAPALAVLFAYLSRARCSAQDGARTAQYIELAVEAAAASPLIPSFRFGRSPSSISGHRVVSILMSPEDRHRALPT
jgi:hypothetical protein